MGKIGNHIIVDPNADEWASMDARITITSDSDGNICALQKGGNDGFTMDEIVKCGEISVRVGAQIREKLKEGQTGRLKKWQKQKNLLKAWVQDTELKLENNIQKFTSN